MIYCLTKIYDGNLDCFADSRKMEEIMNFNIYLPVGFTVSIGGIFLLRFSQRQFPRTDPWAEIIKNKMWNFNTIFSMRMIKDTYFWSWTVFMCDLSTHLNLSKFKSNNIYCIITSYVCWLTLYLFLIFILF